MITKRELKAAGTWAAQEARAAAGEKGLQTLVDVADTALVEAGHRAAARIEERARRRAAKRALKRVGKVALVAGVTAAGIVAARALARRGGRPKKAPARSSRGKRG
ncbi:MAG TPA: hypothetical protein VF978_07550 [Gemmatimonadales bacterium]